MQDSHPQELLNPSNEKIQGLDITINRSQERRRITSFGELRHYVDEKVRELAIQIEKIKKDSTEVENGLDMILKSLKQAHRHRQRANKSLKGQTQLRRDQEATNTKQRSRTRQKRKQKSKQAL